MGSEAYCGGRVRRISTRSFEDHRGRLSPIDFGALAFTPVRAFVVEGRPGAVRGGHGHAATRQVLMLVSGAVEIETRWNGSMQQFRLENDRRAVLIEPPVWCTQTFLRPNSALVVFCDTAYDPEDYIDDPGPAR